MFLGILERDLVFMTSSCLDQVTKVSHTPVSISESATSPPATDVEMEDREPEPEPTRAPTRKTRRKPKKEVPVGRNGLKKRRVVKSRMTTDEKGYFGASASAVIISQLFASFRVFLIDALLSS